MSSREERPESASAPKLGRRRLRLRRLIRVLLIVVTVLTVAGIWWYQTSRPATRRPGENLDEITAKLARGIPEDAPAPRLVDVSGQAGLSEFEAFRGARTSQLPEDMGSGAAWGDVDRDGDQDLFLVSVGGSLTMPSGERARSLLYENLGDGTFEPSRSFPDLRIHGMAAAFGDVDSDGWLDLVVTGYESLLLFRNREGTFELDVAFPSVAGFWAGASWGDYDNDRDLDLYVCGYVVYEPPGEGKRRQTEQYGTTVPYTLNPASFEPEHNLLFENDGSGGFSEVGQFLGVSNPGGRSLGALWHDFDDDGRLDLYVANDISDNALFLNRGDTFEDAGLAAWVADYRGAMGLTAGDWNRDGDADLFVTHWIAQENALYDSRLVDMAEGREADGPVPLRFMDQAAPLGLGQIALQSVGWGTEFVDLDADGWLDLLVANGGTLEEGEAPKRLKPQADMVLWNRRGEFFHDLASLDEELSRPDVARGLAVADFDADGDQDTVIVRLDGAVKLLRNEMQQGSWLQLDLASLDRDGEPDGLGDGATVRVTAGGTEMRRTVTSASYLSQSSRRLHWGLGEASEIDRVEVSWLGGEREVFEGVGVNGVWKLVEGTGMAEPVTAARIVDQPPSSLDERERVMAFWKAQRGAMDAMKRDGDYQEAERLFQVALELDPSHEDSRYYLANLLAARGETEAALEHLDRLRTSSPMSHRAQKQWAVLRASTSREPEDLQAARGALDRAMEINSEETGALLVLGELELIEGDLSSSAQHLEHVCLTNPRSVGGFFLRAYVAWESGDESAAQELLKSAQVARGEEWKPKGTVAEGDVERQMHQDTSLLSPYWEAWDGSLETEAVFAALHRDLTG